jgi:hypothetical protein
MMILSPATATGATILLALFCDALGTPDLNDQQSSNAANYNVVPDYRLYFHESLKKAREDSRAKWKKSKTGLNNLRQQDVDPAIP